MEKTDGKAAEGPTGEAGGNARGTEALFHKLTWSDSLGREGGRYGMAPGPIRGYPAAWRPGAQ